MDREGDKIRQLMNRVNIPFDVDGMSDAQRGFMQAPIYMPMLRDLYLHPEENPTPMENMPLANPGGVIMGPINEESVYQHRHRMT